MTQAFNLAQLANNLNSSGQLDATDGLFGAVPIVSGGTGATTASGAFSNIKQAATTSTSGVVQLATSAEAQAGSDASKGITPASLFGAFQGSNQSMNQTGYQKLPGGLIIQWAQIYFPTVAAYTWVYPIPFPNAPLFVSAQSQDGGFPTEGSELVWTILGWDKNQTNFNVYRLGGAGGGQPFYWQGFALGY